MITFADTKWKGVSNFTGDREIMQGDLRYRYRQKNLKMNEKDGSEGKKKGTRVPRLKIDLCSYPLICFVSHTEKH